MILKYISEVRLFEILFEGLDFYNDGIRQTLLNYINKYIKYKEISSYDLKLNYESFLKQYAKDAKFYLKNNEYPALSSGNNYPITREEYDIFLLLSLLPLQFLFLRLGLDNGKLEVNPCLLGYFKCFNLP